MLLSGSHNNIICGNTIQRNYGGGIIMSNSNENLIYHNNFILNQPQVAGNIGINTWDQGYPSGGNYWSNYIGADNYSGINQDEPGSDGIGDTPYVLNTNNKDNYPLMNRWENELPIADAGLDQTVYAGDIVEFDGSGSYDPDGQIVKTAWNFGDGTTIEDTFTPTHVFYDRGNYTVTLTVVDNDDGESSDTVEITVNPINATINVDPDTLNISSEGKWITGYIRLPAGYDEDEISISTVRAWINDKCFPALWGNIQYGELMVKFDRQAIALYLKSQGIAEGEVTLIITGKVLCNNGLADFEGSDTIRVINN